MLIFARSCDGKRTTVRQTAIYPVARRAAPDAALSAAGTASHRRSRQNVGANGWPRRKIDFKAMMKNVGVRFA